MIRRSWRATLALALAAAPALACAGERRPTEPPALPGDVPRTPPGAAPPPATMPPADAPPAGTFTVKVEGTMTASLAGSVSHNAAGSEISQGNFIISMLTPDTTHIAIQRKGPEQLRPGTHVVGRGWSGDTVTVALVPPLSNPQWVNNNYMADSGVVVVTYRDSISVIGTLRVVASKYYPTDRSTGQITITGAFHSVCQPDHRTRGICGR